MTYPDPAPSTTPIPVEPLPSPDGSEQDSTGAAKQQAHELKDTTTQAATDVVHTAKDQAATVASEAQNQAKDLLHQAERELTSQASSQQQRAATGLRELGEELRGMADRSESAGPATSLSRQAAEQATTLADWLENREPGDVLNEVKRFARKRPAAFLALAAGAGLLTGRLVRGLTADSDGGSNGQGGHPGTPAVPTAARQVSTPVDPAFAAPQTPHIDAGVVPPASGSPHPGPPASGVPYPGPPAPSGDLPGGIRADEGRDKA